jgi:hypothetical protein
VGSTRGCVPAGYKFVRFGWALAIVD